MANFDNDLLREKIEVLDGSRRGKNQKAAVRIEDLYALLQLSQRLKSAKAAGAAPTKAEFDALVDDVSHIHQRLRALSNALQARILP